MAGTAGRPSGWRAVTQGDEAQGRSERGHGHTGPNLPDNDIHNQ